jgi:hypothetical protein
MNDRPRFMTSESVYSSSPGTGTRLQRNLVPVKQYLVLSARVIAPEKLNALPASVVSMKTLVTCDASIVTHRFLQGGTVKQCISTRSRR